MRYMSCTLLLAGVLSGCGKADAPKTKSVIAMEQVPAVVMKAAQKKEPQVTFNKVIHAPNGIYEVQGKTKAGKILEVEVTESGEVTKVE
jgi:hypothetical protein